MAIPSRALLVGLSALALSLPAAAQNQAKTETQRVEEARQQAQDTSSSAAAAAESSVLAGEDVTFEQVLDDPDNIDLNYRFAVAEVRRGNMRSAAGTLERLLLLAPQRADIRLAYAIVLYRMDDLVQARQEFTRLAELPLDAGSAAQVDRYLREIEQRSKRTRYYAQLTLGGNYDTNRTSGPDNNRILLGGVPRSIAGTAGSQKSDWAVIGSGTVGFTHDLDTPRGDEVFGRAVYYHGEQHVLSSFDIQAVYAELGRTFNYSFGNFTAKVRGSATRLSHENYLNAFGGEVRFDHKVSEDLRLFEIIDADYQNYQPIGENGLADNDDGLGYGITFGGRYKARSDLLIDAHVRVGAKNARAQTESYHGPEFGARGTWLLDRGMFAQFGGTYRVDSYEEINAFISPSIRREDRILRLRGTLGVPLSNMIGIDNTPSWLRQSVVTLGLGYTHSMSTLANFDYDNVKFSAVLNKRWDF